jgi:hypothetical protein
MPDAIPTTIAGSEDFMAGRDPRERTGHPFSD